MNLSLFFVWLVLAGAAYRVLAGDVSWAEWFLPVVGVAGVTASTPWVERWTVSNARSLGKWPDPRVAEAVGLLRKTYLELVTTHLIIFVSAWHVAKWWSAAYQEPGIPLPLALTMGTVILSILLLLIPLHRACAAKESAPRLVVHEDSDGGDAP